MCTMAADGVYRSCLPRADNAVEYANEDSQTSCNTAVMQGIGMPVWTLHSAVATQGCKGVATCRVSFTRVYRVSSLVWLR